MYAPTFKRPASLHVARVAERVGDGIPPVASEIARADLHAGWRLSALVLGNVEQMLDPLYGRRMISFGADRFEGHFVLDEAFEDTVENVIRRERVLILLIFPQFGARRFRDDPLRDNAASRA